MANTFNYFSMETANQEGGAQTGQGEVFQQRCMQAYTSDYQNSQESFSQRAEGWSQQENGGWLPEAGGGPQQWQQNTSFLGGGAGEGWQQKHFPSASVEEGQWQPSMPYPE